MKDLFGLIINQEPMSMPSEMGHLGQIDKPLFLINLWPPGQDEVGHMHLELRKEVSGSQLAHLLSMRRTLAHFTEYETQSITLCAP